VAEHDHQLKLNAIPYGIKDAFVFPYNCSICSKPQTNAPSFQCPPCRFDMCIECSKTKKVKPIPEHHIAISSKHQHELHFMVPYGQEGYICNLCSDEVAPHIPSWHCKSCNFDACIPCMSSTYADSTLVRVRGGKRQALIYESTAVKSDVPDVTSGWRPYSGVHAFALPQKLAAHGLGNDGTKMTYIPLKAPLDSTQESILIQWLRDQHFLKIPVNVTQEFASHLPFLKHLGLNKKDDLSKMFSSELVAAALKQACALPKDIAAVHYTPDDLVNSPIYNKAGAVLFSNHLAKK